MCRYIWGKNIKLLSINDVKLSIKKESLPTGLKHSVNNEMLLKYCLKFPFGKVSVYFKKTNVSKCE